MDSKEIKKQLDNAENRFKELTKEFEEKVELYRDLGLPPTDEQKAELKNLLDASWDSLGERVQKNKEYTDARTEEIKSKYSK